jgi:hypothetical protein
MANVPPFLKVAELKKNKTVKKMRRLSSVSACISVSRAEETGGSTFLIWGLGAVKTRPVALATIPLPLG